MPRHAATNPRAAGRVCARGRAHPLRSALGQGPAAVLRLLQAIFRPTKVLCKHCGRRAPHRDCFRAGSRRHVRTVRQLPAGRVFGTMPCRCFPYASKTRIIAPPQLDVPRPADLSPPVRVSEVTPGARGKGFDAWRSTPPTPARSWASAWGHPVPRAMHSSVADTSHLHRIIAPRSRCSAIHCSSAGFGAVPRVICLAV